MSIRSGLSQDLSHVTVTASMVKEISNYLTENTRFWVVRARVAGGEVSGLSTLFSGAYIGMDPGAQGQTATTNFVGLETPPAVAVDTPGSYFNLRAERLGSLDIGSPVFYRQIKVGQVVSYEMTEDGSAVTIKVFIQAPHNDKVRQNTRFWKASGMELTVSTSGIKINTESLSALLVGGIGFETPTDLEPGAKATAGQTFALYNSRDLIDEPLYSQKSYFVAFFNESVRGLEKGAPVEFSGIKVGEVVDIKLEFDQKKSAFQIPVLMAIEPARVAGRQDSQVNRDLFESLIQKGLRAQLRTGLLLTGQLYVNLGMYPDAPAKPVLHSGNYAVIPTLPGSTQEITASIASFVNRLEKLPVEQIGGDLSESLRQIKKVVGSEDLRASISSLRRSLDQLQRFTTTLNKTTAPQLGGILQQLQQTLDQTNKTLSAAENLVSGDAPLTYDMRQAMIELAKAGRAVSLLADYLQRNPETLLFGKGAPQP